MPEQYSEEQIQAKIAERRAKTEQMRKKKWRKSLLQVIAVLLAIIVLVFLVIFGVRYTIRRMNEAAEQQAAAQQAEQTQPPETVMNPIEETEPSGDGPSWSTTPDETEPAEPTPEEPGETGEPEETGEPVEEQEPEEPPAPAQPDLGEEDEAEIAPGAHSDVVIFVDAGRGYSDHGCTSDYLNGGENYESQINLAMAKLVAQRLREYGFTVKMTHTTNAIPAGEAEDYALDQLTRVDMANSSGTYLYLSLHCDNFPDNEKASGTRLYYCTDRKGSSAFADSLAASARNSFGTAPKIAGYATDRAFIVTSQITCPSVLVEMGFVTNKTDAENLLDENWRSKMADALAGGVIAYFEAYH